MTTPAPEPPVRERPENGRVAYWDNARFIAITLVVIGHAIQRLTADNDAAFALYLIIYSFHMPLFAIASGWFSKATPPDAIALQRLMTAIVIPYLIFETIWTAVRFIVQGGASLNPTTASWTLWFLLALAIFRLVLPYLARLREPVLWVVVLGVGIGVGYWPNVDDTFSLARALGLLPFVVLGWRAREWGLGELWLGGHRLSDRIDGVPRTVLRIAAASLLIAWSAVIVIGLDHWREVNLRLWLFYTDPYGAMDAPEWWAGIIRLGLLVLTTALCAAVLVLAPRRTTAFTSFGTATLYVYLLHTFALYPIRESGVLGGENSGWPWLVGMIVLAIVIAVVLSTPFVRRIARPLVEPRVDWLFRRER